VLPVAADVVVTGRGQLPRTTSGKVRRAECAERLRDGRIKVLGRWPRG
jgi:acyl-CoA synthetase (AMP-forming)/AMP-acid ligase II